MQTDEEENLLDASLFSEPSHFRPPTPPSKTVNHETKGGKLLNLRLVGFNPLWGHYLWNGAKTLSSYLETNASLVKGKDVLELGAGGGLPGLVAAFECHARAVVITDYPDEDLIANIRHNIESNQSCQAASDNRDDPTIAKATGYLWGQEDVDFLFKLCDGENRQPKGFDLLLLADLNFNHHCHQALADTICLTLRRTQEARALVFFTPYRPWLLENDLAFFGVCRNKGLVVNKLLVCKMDDVMFKDDPGSEELRRTVFGYAVSWP